MIDWLKRLFMRVVCKFIGHKEYNWDASQVFDDKIIVCKCVRCGHVTRVIVERKGYYDHTTTGN